MTSYDCDVLDGVVDVGLHLAAAGAVDDRRNAVDAFVFARFVKSSALVHPGFDLLAADAEQEADDQGHQRCR